jgi:hypothetical protein
VLACRGLKDRPALRVYRAHKEPRAHKESRAHQEPKAHQEIKARKEPKARPEQLRRQQLRFFNVAAARAAATRLRCPHIYRPRMTQRRNAPEERAAAPSSGTW